MRELRTALVLLAANLCAPAVAQKADPRAVEAAKAVGTSMAQYAQKAALCDKVSPGTWDRTKRELKQIAPSFWNATREKEALAAVETEKARAGIEDWKNSVANREIELKDLQQSCAESLEESRTLFRDNWDTMAFLAN